MRGVQVQTFDFDVLSFAYSDLHQDPGTAHQHSVGYPSPRWENALPRR